MPQQPTLYDDQGKPITPGVTAIYDDNGKPVTQPSQPSSEPPKSTSWLDSTKDFLASAWHQVNPIAGAQGISQAVVHPVATAQSYGQSNVEIEREAEEAFKRGDYGTGVVKSLYYLLNGIPGLGASLNQSANQLSSGQVAKGLGTATGLGLQASALGRSLTQPEPSLGTVERADSTKTPGSQTFAKGMMPTSGKNRSELAVMAQKVAPDVMAETSSRTLGGLSEEVGQKLSVAKDAIDRAIDAVPTGKTFATKPILDELLQARSNLTLKGSSEGLSSGAKRIVLPQGNEAAAGVLDRAIAEVRGLGPNVDLAALRGLRQAWDKLAESAKVYAKTPAELTSKAEGSAWADAAHTVRGYLADRLPNLAEANKAYSLYKTADKVIKSAQLSDFLESTKLTPKGTTLAGLVSRAVDAAIAGRTSRFTVARLLNSLNQGILGKNTALITAAAKQLSVMGTETGVVAPKHGEEIIK